jgi:hypothetical protein
MNILNLNMNIKEIVKYTILLFFFFIAFLMPLDKTFLTINEELFVVISFVLFLDLIGNTLLNGIANVADLKIKSITNRFVYLLMQESNTLIDLYATLIVLMKLSNFKNLVINGFRKFTIKAIKVRFFDRIFLNLQQYFYLFRTEMRYHYNNNRIIGILATLNATFQFLANEKAAYLSKKADKDSNLLIRTKTNNYPALNRFKKDLTTQFDANGLLIAKTIFILQLSLLNELFN